MQKMILIAVAALFLTLAACGDDRSDAAGAGDRTTPSVQDEFTTLDVNGDSYLDADEIAEWEDDEGAFRQWDADADSELDRDEIAGNAFALWDADGNGRISQKEWRQGTVLWYPDDVDYDVFNDWDGDGDSELDSDEFAERFDHSLLGESWTTESIGKETFKEAYFELYDADDDGRVSRSEWTRGSGLFGIAG